MKAIGYTRVSTDEQAQFGVSLASQKEKIQQYAGLYGHEIKEIIEDAGISAKNLNRPGVQNVLAMMKQKAVDAVIVAKLDRLTRSVRDLADIIELANKKGISLISVNEHIDTGTAAGRMILNMLGTISQWERETIGERTKTAIDYKRARGESYPGRSALYGYQKQGERLVHSQEEQQVITVITTMKDTCNVADICRELERRAIGTRNGSKVWHSKVVAKIIADEPIRTKINESIFKMQNRAA